MGRPVTAFAYPYGTLADFARGRRRSWRGSGYDCAFTSQHGPVRPGMAPLPLPRVKVEAGDPSWLFPRFCARGHGRLAPGRPGPVARPAPAGRPAGRLSRPSTGTHGKARGAERNRHRPPGERTRTNSPSRRYPTSGCALALPARRPSPPAAALGAVDYGVPGPGPFPAPGERAAADRAGLLRQVGFPAHPGHAHEPSSEPRAGGASWPGPTAPRAATAARARGRRRAGRA